MNAIFITEREAREYIARNYEEDVIIKTSSVCDSDHFDIDEVPYPWGGETSAFEVDGEDYIAYLEADNIYTVSFGEISETTESLYAARNIAEEIKDIAEDLNISGNIVITSKIDGELDDIEVERYVEDEPEGDPEKLVKNWNRAKIGKMIRKEREHQCMTVQQLAKISGLSKNNIKRIESGLYNYSIDNLQAILSALDLNLNI